MVGVGKLLKQAQKMQKKMEEAQERLSDEILEVSGGGGAVTVKINGQGEFKELILDPEFLKEGAAIDDCLSANHDVASGRQGLGIIP